MKSTRIQELERPRSDSRGTELCQSSRRAATRTSYVGSLSLSLDLFEVILDPPKSESTHLLNPRRLRRSGSLWPTPLATLRGTRHRIQATQSRCKGGAAVMVEITSSPLSSFAFTSTLHYHHSTSRPLFHYPSASLDYNPSYENRTNPTPPRVNFSYGQNPSGVYVPSAISEIPSQ